MPGLGRGNGKKANICQTSAVFCTLNPCSFEYLDYISGITLLSTYCPFITDVPDAMLNVCGF